MILNRVIFNLWDKDGFTVSGAIIQTNLMDLIIFLCRDKNHRSNPRSHVSEKGGGNTETRGDQGPMARFGNDGLLSNDVSFYWYCPGAFT